MNAKIALGKKIGNQGFLLLPDLSEFVHINENILELIEGKPA